MADNDIEVLAAEEICKYRSRLQDRPRLADPHTSEHRRRRPGSAQRMSKVALEAQREMWLHRWAKATMSSEGFQQRFDAAVKISAVNMQDLQL